MKQVLIALSFLYATTTVSAQSGLYLTAEDFEENKVSYQKTGDEKHLIRASIPFNAAEVKVVNGDESFRLAKAALYGYKNSKNEDFRFYNDNSYKIIDSRGFLLYSREENIVRGKAKTRETRYYFSKDADSPMMSLSTLNLKYAFPMSREFHDLLDLQFRSDRELVRYDRFHNEYKLKAIFHKTIN